MLGALVIGSLRKWRPRARALGSDLSQGGCLNKTDGSLVQIYQNDGSQVNYRLLYIWSLD